VSYLTTLEDKLLWLSTIQIHISLIYFLREISFCSKDHNHHVSQYFWDQSIQNELNQLLQQYLIKNPTILKLSHVSWLTDISAGSVVIIVSIQWSSKDVNGKWKGVGVAEKEHKKMEEVVPQGVVRYNYNKARYWYVI